MYVMTAHNEADGRWELPTQGSDLKKRREFLARPSYAGTMRKYLSDTVFDLIGWKDEKKVEAAADAAKTAEVAKAGDAKDADKKTDPAKAAEMDAKAAREAAEKAKGETKKQAA